MDKDVTISGGADNLAVDGNASDRVFYINPDNTVTISGLTITNGTRTRAEAAFEPRRPNVERLHSERQPGGGILNLDRGGNATLAVTNCTVSGNSPGGIVNMRSMAARH